MSLNSAGLCRSVLNCSCGCGLLFFLNNGKKSSRELFLTLNNGTIEYIMARKVRANFSCHCLLLLKKNNRKLMDCFKLINCGCGY